MVEHFFKVVKSTFFFAVPRLSTNSELTASSRGYGGYRGYSNSYHDCYCCCKIYSLWEGWQQLRGHSGVTTREKCFFIYLLASFFGGVVLSILQDKSNFFLEVLFSSEMHEVMSYELNEGWMFQPFSPKSWLIVRHDYAIANETS